MGTASPEASDNSGFHSLGGMDHLHHPNHHLFQTPGAVRAATMMPFVCHPPAAFPPVQMAAGPMHYHMPLPLQIPAFPAVSPCRSSFEMLRGTVEHRAESPPHSAFKPTAFGVCPCALTRTLNSKYGLQIQILAFSPYAYFPPTPSDSNDSEDEKVSTTV